MTDNSRIRFNPVTKEIEIEGTEAFVKTYFDRVQALISGITEDEPAEAAHKTKPVSKKRITNIDKIVSLILSSKKGMSTDDLKRKTGLDERQIWSIVYRAAKEGKIRKLKRGAYGAVAAS